MQAVDSKWLDFDDAFRENGITVEFICQEDIQRLHEDNSERRQTRAPVIVLTGTEVFTAGYLSTSWEEKGGKHEDLSKQATFGTSNLRILANFTQHLYLDMEMLPYGPAEAQIRESFERRINHLRKTKG